MTYTFLIRPRKDERPEFVKVAEPGDISLDFNVNTPEGAKDVQDFLDIITKVEVKPGLKSVYRNPAIGWRLMLFGVVLFIAFCFCAWFLYKYQDDHPALSLFLAAAWTVLVPVYFYFEHEFLYYYYGDPDKYEQFKRVQDLAAKIWAGAIAVLGAILAVNLKN